MASAPVAVAAKLTIPNKKDHLNERNKLHGNYEKLGERIVRLKGQRGELERDIRNNITNITSNALDDAIQALNIADREVQSFNQKCQSTQNRIYINNDELQQLLDRITTGITQARATKAAKEAASAAAAKTASEEAAALQQAKEALQAYITSL